jgi:hypothetical protein
MPICGICFYLGTHWRHQVWRLRISRCRQPHRCGATAVPLIGSAPRPLGGPKPRLHRLRAGGVCVTAALLRVPALNAPCGQPPPPGSTSLPIDWRRTAAAGRTNAQGQARTRGLRGRFHRRGVQCPPPPRHPLGCRLGRLAGAEVAATRLSAARPPQRAPAAASPGRSGRPRRPAACSPPARPHQRAPGNSTKTSAHDRGFGVRRGADQSAPWLAGTRGQAWGAASNISPPPPPTHPGPRNPAPPPFHSSFFHSSRPPFTPPAPPFTPPAPLSLLPPPLSLPPPPFHSSRPPFTPPAPLSLLPPPLSLPPPPFHSPRPPFTPPGPLSLPLAPFHSPRPLLPATAPLHYPEPPFDMPLSVSSPPLSSMASLSQLTPAALPCTIASHRLARLCRRSWTCLLGGGAASADCAAVLLSAPACQIAGAAGHRPACRRGWGFRGAVVLLLPGVAGVGGAALWPQTHTPPGAAPSDIMFA